MLLYSSEGLGTVWFGRRRRGGGGWLGGVGVGRGLGWDRGGENGVCVSEEATGEYRSG